MTIARLLAMCLLTSCELWVGQVASGQAQGVKARDGERSPNKLRIESVNFPFGQQLTADRWSPVIVRISSGARAVQGVVTLSYPQDGTQDASISVRASTTPGVTVPVELAACVPGACQALVVTFSDDSGRVLDSTYINFGGSGPGVSALKPMQGTLRLLVAGDDGLAEAIGDRGSLSSEEQQDDDGPPSYPGQPVPERAGMLRDLVVLDTVGSVRELPRAWLSYEGTDVVIARATELAKADARARAALLEWVGAGGRLALVVDGAGADWKQFVPGWEGLFEVSDVRVGTPGEAARRATLPARRPKLEQPEATASPGRGKPQVVRLGPAGELPSPTSFPLRTVRVSEEGRRSGWRNGWQIEEEPSGDVGLIASGPVGMGIVTLVGADFGRLDLTKGFASARAAWLNLLADKGLSPVATRVLDAVQASGSRLGWSMTGWNSGSNLEAQAAISGSLESITSSPDLGIEVFLGIGACGVLLAIGIGPVERMLTRRRTDSRWHVTRALAWIGVMSAAGLLMPVVMRRGGSERRSGEVIDIIAPLGVGWRTGVVSSYTAQPEEVTLPSGAGVWHRGVGAGFAYWDPRRREVFSPLRARLSLSDGAGSPGSVIVSAARQPQWTVRTFMHQSAAAALPQTLPAVGVSTIEGGWRVKVSDIPTQARLGEVKLATRHGLFGVAIAVTDDASGRVGTGEVVVARTENLWDGQWQTQPADLQQWQWSPHQRTFQYPLLALPGVRDRDDAIAARVLGGGWVCVMIEILDAMDGYTRPGGGRQVLRVLVPVPEEVAP